MNPWFRMYHEFATDPKVQMLSEADQRRFVMLLCLRCCNGDVTLHDDAIAFQLRISADEWTATKLVLTERGLIDADNKPTNWSKRQHVSDSSKSRVSKHREAKKQACNGDVTLQKRPGNVPDTDTDTDTDTDKNTPVHSEQVAAREDGRTDTPADLKSAFNGSTETMLAFVEAAMGPNSRPNAIAWLTATTSAHGSVAVAQAFASLAEKRAAGEVITRPLPLWSSIAAGMRAGRPSKQREPTQREQAAAAFRAEGKRRMAALQAALEADA